MTLEILLALPVGDKTFFYKRKILEKNKPKIGQIVKVKFRNKKQIGIVLKIPKKININKKLLEIESSYENYFFNEEIIESINFLSKYTCNSLSIILKNFLSGFKENLKRLELVDYNHKFKLPTLSDEQKKALSSINKKVQNSFNVISLYGVTGSGKTRVYMNIVKEKLKKKFQCLILVPEIILTKEWVNEIFDDFGIVAEIYHSSIKASKKANIWNHIILNKSVLIIGTRSSLFLPFKNLGIIVVDEEHDSSYKQEDKLIINARDFAIIRAKNSNCPIILSSATPSIENVYNCKKKKFLEIQMLERVNKVPLPNIQIVDMRKEKNIISEELILQIKKNLHLNLQTMIFINKRGYTSFTLCKKCGFIKQCPKCNVSLVLHNYINKESFLLCHHCSYREKFTNYCNNCDSEGSIIFPGEGIEKIYEEIQKKFSGSKNIFISSDSTKNKANLNSTLKEIISNDINIIVGTQILSKGHNFPHLKTVGILNIDHFLNDFDFRSFEKCFQQIIQVSGRAGRKDQEGNVVIQTFQPDHIVFKNCQKYSFKNFYDQEIKRRRKFEHPPFSNFISLVITSISNTKSLQFSNFLSNNLKKNFKHAGIFGPAPAVISMKNNKYRYRVLIKLKKNYALQSSVKEFIKKFKVPSEVKLYIDVDPISFL
ncbi:MAG: primosomal protein N' [Rickettsiales bacterium]|nr:primosomal protein N' [Rickettsiales bacterium]RPG13339.1 MAG: primosomal protein N' [Pelagibacteraceae bacterium TMED195]|tara:strand:- start:669 stop:2633 length:1965 start_codon:yes stop_codon:yes gene_type:complete